MRKKLFIFLSILFALVILVACDDPKPTEPTDSLTPTQTQPVETTPVEPDYQAAINAIIAHYAETIGSKEGFEVTEDLVLLANINGVAITWTSDLPAYVAIDGTVTRPTFAEGDKTVTLTVTVGDKTNTYTIKIPKLPPVASDFEAAMTALKANYAATIGSAEGFEVTEDLVLIGTINGIDVTWTSSLPDYVAADGTVTRPTYAEGDKTVTLTATIGDKTFAYTITIPKLPPGSAEYEAAMNLLKDHYAATIGSKVGYEVTEDLVLLETIGGFDVTWTSNAPAFVAIDGTVTRPAFAEGDKNVILTATIGDKTNTFMIKVPKLPQTIEEKIDAVLTIVTIVPTSTTGYQETNFEITSTYLIDEVEVTITWTTSDATVMTAAGALVSFEDAPEKSVTLTASITHEGVTRTKAIDFLVRGVTEYDTFTEALTAANEKARVKVLGVSVFRDVDNGYFLISSDSSLAYVHGKRNNANVPAGKLIDVILTVDNYFGLLQAASVSATNPRDGDLPTPTFPVETFENLTGTTPPAKGSEFLPYSVTLENVKVVVLTEPLGGNVQYNTFLVPFDFDPAVDIPKKDNSLMIFYPSAIDKLRALDGFSISSIHIVLYTFRTDFNLWSVDYFGVEGDIELALTDVQTVDVAANTLKGTLNYNYYKDGNLVLPEDIDGVEVAWTTDDATVIDLENKKVLATGLEVQKTVTLTATLTYNEVTKVVTFTTIAGPLTLGTTKDIRESDTAKGERWFKIEVVILANSANGTYIAFDGEGTIAIYNGKNDLEVGYEYTLVGTKDIYNGLVQITSLDTVEKGDAVALPAPIVLTEANLKDSAYMLSIQSNLVTINGAEITAFAEDRGTFTGTFKLGTATIPFRVDYRIPLSTEEKALLSGLKVGDNVNLIGIPLGWFSGPQLAFDNLTQIVVLIPETDEEIVNVALADINLPEITDESLTLITEGRFGATVVWTTSNTDVITAAGVLTAPDNNVIVTLTAAVTKGEVTKTKVFNVYVQVDESYVSVELARKLEKDDAVVLEGLITALDDTFIYVSDPSGLTIVLYHPTRYEGIAVGDLIRVSGTIDVYGGLIQVKNATLIEKDTGLPVPDAIDLDTIPKFTVDDQGRRYNISDLFVLSVSGRSMTVSDGENRITVYVDPNDPDLVTYLATAVGKKVSLVNIVLGWYNSAQFLIKAEENVIITELTAEEKANMDLNEIELPAMVIEEITLTLPLVGVNGSTIVWSTNNADVITAAGVVSFGNGPETVILTATITVGELEIIKDFSIVVAELVVIENWDFGSTAVTGYNAGDLTWTNGNGTEITVPKDRVQINTSTFAPHDGGHFLVLSLNSSNSSAWLELDFTEHEDIVQISFEANVWNNSLLETVKNTPDGLFILQQKVGENWVNLKTIDNKSNLLPLLAFEQYVEFVFEVDGPGMYKIIYSGVSSVSGNTTNAITVDNLKVYGIKPEGVEETVFTVSFDTGGGSVVADREVIEGEKVIKPANPKKEGFNFVEWQLDGEPYDFSAEVTKDFELVAIWKEVTIQDIEDVVEEAIGNTVKFIGVVTGFTDYNSQYTNYDKVWIEDETGAVTINRGALPEELVIGDKFEITGIIAHYSGLIQVTNITYELISSKNDLIEPDDIESVDELTVAYMAKRVNIEGRVVSISSNGQTLVINVNGKNITVRSNSNSAEHIVNAHMLNAEVGQIVKLKNIHVDWYNGPQFTPTLVAQIEFMEFTNQDKLDLAELELEDLYTDAVFSMDSVVDLLEESEFGVEIDWVVDPVEAIEEGKWITVEEDTEVTLTATLTIGELTKELTFDVTIKLLSGESFEATAALDSSITVNTSMTDDSFANLVGLDSDLFEVFSTKRQHSSEIHIALNHTEDGQLRMYNGDIRGNILTINIAEGYKLTGFKFTIATPNETEVKITFGDDFEMLAINGDKGETFEYDGFSTSQITIEVTGSKAFWIYTNFTLTYEEA